MSYTVFIFGLYVHHLLTICTLLFPQLQALNEYISDGDTYWNSTSDFVSTQNASYGTIELRTGFYMEFDIKFHGKTVDKTWENIFRIGHAGHSSTDYKCAKNDRFPAMWVDDDRNAFVFDVSDKQNCFRQYGNVIIEPHILYQVILHYNSSWIYIKLNNVIITNQARANTTASDKLGTAVHIYLSTATSIAADVTLSNIFIHSYDDRSSLAVTATSSSPTASPSNAPTANPSLTPTVNEAPTKRPTTLLPTAFAPYEEDDHEYHDDDDDVDIDVNSTHFILSVTEPQRTTFMTTYNTLLNTMTDATGILSIEYFKKPSGLSFEVIFYILTGCAMGGILFCVCTCCCFGCIINKKIRNLSAHEHHDDEEQQDMINRQHDEGDKDHTHQLYVDESKLRVYTVSADNSHSVKQTTDESLIMSNEPETITRSPTINRISSPSSALSLPSFHSPSNSSSNTQSPKTIKTPTNHESFADLGSSSNSNSNSNSNRPQFTKKFHKRLTKLKENDDQHKLRMTHSVPIYEAQWQGNKERGIQIQRREDMRHNSNDSMDTVIEIETEKTIPSGEEQHRLTAISPLNLSVQYDSTRVSYFNSSYSKNTSNRPVFSNPSTANYSTFVQKPRSPLILDMNVVDDDNNDNVEHETQTETETQHSTILLQKAQQQQQQQSKTSSKHYQIQIDYANSEETATTTTNKRTPIPQQQQRHHDVKSMGDIEMDDIETMESLHKESESNKEDEELKADRLYSCASGESPSKRNGSFKSMRRNAAKMEIDIDEAIKKISMEDDDDANSKKESDKAKEFLKLPYNDSGMSRVSNSSNYSNSSASSASSCSTSCSSSSASSSNSDSTSCSSSECSSSDESTDGNTLDALNIDLAQRADDIMSNLSGSSAYYSNATGSYVD